MNYAQIRTMDISDGPGIRVALYVSGCNFHCKNCYSQEQQDFNYGEKFTEKQEDFILDKLKSPHVAGLSILGGDPLWQDSDGLSQLIYLAAKTQGMGKTVWIWSGFTWEQVFAPAKFDRTNKDLMNGYYREVLIRICDVWVDGLFIDELKDITHPYHGSSNQRVIDVQKTLENYDNGNKKIVLYCE